MYPKLFIENFWRGEEKDEVFVFMPIDQDGKFHKKFKAIIEPAIRNIKLEPKRTGSGRNEIIQEVIDGILHARILIFDLSNDPEFKGKINGNVLYELGLATNIRNLSDLVLIREEKSNIEEVPFNIRTLQINFNCPNDDILLLEGKLNNALQQKDWQKHKLLEIAKNSMDPVGFNLIAKNYREKQIFNCNLSYEERLSALRLIDLGILKGLPAVRGKECERLEYSYCFTLFGQAFKKYLELDKWFPNLIIKN